jgi:hypothetical protein
MSRLARALLVVVLLSLGLVLAPTPALAASIAVGGGCTLADAITAANTDTATGGCVAGSGDDTIVLETDATYTLTASDNTDSFWGPTGLPVITSNITIQGNGATIARSDAAGDFRLLRQFGGNLTLQNLTLSNGRATAALYGSWGGCFIAQSGTLTIAAVTLTGCTALGSGASIHSIAQTLTITGSTFTNNSSFEVVRLSGAEASTMTNSTIVGNSTTDGIASTDSSANLLLTNVTIAQSGHSAAADTSGALSARNSILLPAPRALNGGVYTDLGNNITSGDPVLSSLQDNGGPTLTMLPLPGSPAFDAAASANCPATDQRGITRPQGAGCEIGAVEVVPTAPVLTVPQNHTVEATGPGGATATYSASAVDYTGKPASVACLPASGATFAITATTVNCTATDALNQTAFGSFSVTVQDTTGPTFTSVPDPITVEATGSSGAVVTYSVTASDLVDGTVSVNCTPPSGNTFVIGTTTVNCSATDSRSNQSTTSFTVTVQDTAGPTFTSVPGPMTVEATGSTGAVASYSVTASDLVDGPVNVSCLPLSGSTFAIGTTTVNCTATDSHSNDATTSFTVTVQDTTAPAFTSVPAPITAEASGPAGAVVTYSVSASDLVDGAVPVSCTPVSGSTFAITTTTVNCSATDAHDNEATTSFTVTVQDTTGPVFTSVPSPIAVPATSPAGAVVTYSVTASDLVDGAVSVSCTPASGATFPIGTTTVQCSTTDARSNESTTSFEVTVGTPVITSLSPNRVALNARSQTIVIRGTGFISGATVRVGTTEYAATFISDSELRITIVPRQAFALGGWLILPLTPVQVVNPGGVLSNGTYLALQR